jgi:hypothetical protein
VSGVCAANLSVQAKLQPQDGVLCLACALPICPYYLLLCVWSRHCCCWQLLVTVTWQTRGCSLSWLGLHHACRMYSWQSTGPSTKQGRLQRLVSDVCAPNTGLKKYTRCICTKRWYGFACADTHDQELLFELAGPAARVSYVQLAVYRAFYQAG